MRTITTETVLQEMKEENTQSFKNGLMALPLLLIGIVVFAMISAGRKMNPDKLGILPTF